MEEILRLFPAPIRKEIDRVIANRWLKVQEIRVRISQPIEVIFDQKVEWLYHVIPDKESSIFIINQLSQYSLYRLETELRQGYITIQGGHRIGLAGKVNTENGFVKAIQSITFMNIRIAKEKIGVARSLIPYMYQNNYLNTLIVGAPQTGKTTLLRDMARIIATGWNNIQPGKVGVVDERSEIAAAINGIPQHNLGLRTDVMDACPKAEGMMMLIRSMSPEILVVDEIGSSEDVAALMEAIHSGVTIVCTIHGQSMEELKKRPSLQPIFSQKIFKRHIMLEKSRTPGKIKSIYDQHETNIYRGSGCQKVEMDWSTSFN